MIEKLSPDVEAALNPGIKNVVLWLRERGFDTCDSGDGLTNVRARIEHALPHPHVHVRVTPSEMVHAARDLRMELAGAGVIPSPCAKCRYRGEVWSDVKQKPVPCSCVDLRPMLDGVMAVSIEATYSPIDDVATITLLNVNDAALAGTPLDDQRVHIGYVGVKECGETDSVNWWMWITATSRSPRSLPELCPGVTGCDRCST